MTPTKHYSVSMSAFSQYPATQKLKNLARTPYDLTSPDGLTPERLERMYGEACGFKLLYGTERVNDQVMVALAELAMQAQVVKKMERMQAGDVVNKIEGYPSDNRAVLHTAMRDFFENPNTSKPAVQATSLAKQELEKVKNLMTMIDKENKFTDLIAIGIGGSDLGPKALYQSLAYLTKQGRRIHFISNLDPDEPARVLNHVNLKQTLVVVVSKSGTTLETATNEEWVRERYKAANLKPEEHIISVSGPGTPMDDPKRYLRCFHFWDYVGGRFCATSVAGAVSLSFAFGFDVFVEILRGANAMDKTALKTDIKENLPLLDALLSVWNRNFLNHATLALVPYSQALWRFPAHIQQVEMESNGKCIDRDGNPVDFETGPIIFGEPGTSAQHSFYQLIHQGTTVVPVEFIGFSESQYGEDLVIKGTTSQEKLLSNLFAQAIALAVGQKSDNPNKVFHGNRPTHMLLGKKLTPFALGALFAHFEHKVAFEGFILNINPFDQQGVELGKVLADKIIHQFADKRRKEPGASAAFPLGQAFLNQLKTLK